MIAAPATVATTKVPLPASFNEWRVRVRSLGLPPVVGVAGSRGKTTVVRLLEAIFHAAGLKTAVWTDAGVEIRGRRQRGELVPWSRAMARLGSGSLDVALQELNWATVRAVGLPRGAYPVVAVTNVCVNSDACLITDDARLANAALPAVMHSVHPDGLTVLNGEDYAVAGGEVAFNSPALLVALKRETPRLRAHLAADGLAAWIGPAGIELSSDYGAISLGQPARAFFSLHGMAGFQMHNAIIAASAAVACGISPRVIAEVIESYRPDPFLIAGSFTVVPRGGSTVIIDRPTPSWFLRPVLRAVRALPDARLVAVLGQISGVPLPDLPEIGRLIGRISDAVILHSEAVDAERAGAIRAGVALNDLPPVIVHVPTERRAINRALRSLRPGDTLFIVSEQSSHALRTVLRSAEPETVGGELLEPVLDLRGIGGDRVDVGMGA